MSIDMNLPSAQSQSSGISTFVSSKNRGYSELITALNQFIMMTPNLQGATYESAKSYAQSVFLPLAQGCILLNESFGESVSNYVSGYCSKVIGKSLKSSELEGKIAQRRAAITRLHEQMDRLLRMDKPQAKLLNSLKRRLDFELGTVEELEELLQKLTSFHAESASYFDNLEALYNAVQQGLSQLTSSWNPATNTFVLPAVNDMGWARIINQQWHDRVTTRANALIVKAETGHDLTSDEFNELGRYLSENPNAKYYNRGYKVLQHSSKEDGVRENFIKYLIKPDFISEGTAQIHPWFKTGYTMTKNFGSAVSKKYTKDSFLKYGTIGQKANHDLKISWRSLKAYARSKNWQWYSKLGHKWKKGSFNNFLNTFQYSVLDKISNTKVGNYSVKRINKVIGNVTDPIKSSIKKTGDIVKKSKVAGKLKFVGKAAKVAGWVAVATDIGITSLREYNNKDSRAYQSVGKSAIHAGVAQLKSAGPIEGAIAGSAVGGPWGALIGFGAGTVNSILGVAIANQKDAFYSWVQNGLDDGYDAVKNGLNKVAKGTWDTMTN